MARQYEFPAPMVVSFLLALVFGRSLALGEVVSSNESGFQIQIQQTIHADVHDCFRQALRIQQWWSSDHTYSGDQKNLYLEPKPGGWFGEKLPEGGFVKHLELIHLAPNKLIRLTGGLGPLQEMGVNGALTLKFEQMELDTMVTLTYHVSGFAPSGLDKIAPAVNHVLSEQIDNLKEAVEKDK